MQHPDIELLTQFALDDPLALDAATLVHVNECEQCTREIEQLRRVVDATLLIGGRSELRVFETPSPDVWSRIVAEIDAAEGEDGEGEEHAPGESAAAQPPADDAAPAPIPLVARHRDPSAPAEEPASRRRGWTLLAAAVAGVVIGAGVTWAVARDSDDGSQPTTIATSELSGFDGHDASGTATLEDKNSRQALKIDLDPGQVGDGFLQVWLLDADTGGMVALGVLDDDNGTFAVPHGLDLAQYSQIDVSLEPFDGDPAHSAVSLARGPVPDGQT